MTVRILLPFLVTLFAALSGCEEEKPKSAYEYHTCSEQSLQDGTCRNLTQVVLITTEDAEQCLDKAGIDPKRKPYIAWAAPGEYWVLYQTDGATLHVDCTRYLLGR